MEREQVNKKPLLDTSQLIAERDEDVSYLCTSDPKPKSCCCCFYTKKGSALLKAFSKWFVKVKSTKTLGLIYKINV